MRIAYVGPVPPHRGGIAQHGLRTVEAFERLGHEVVIESWKSLYPAALFKGERPSVPRRGGQAVPALRRNGADVSPRGCTKNAQDSILKFFPCFCKRVFWCAC